MLTWSEKYRKTSAGYRRIMIRLLSLKTLLKHLPHPIPRRQLLSKNEEEAKLSIDSSTSCLRESPVFGSSKDLAK
jgi:hypothetical protein